MIVCSLFWGFLQVGLFSFGGGYASIPLIRDVVLSYGWLDDEMLTYMIAVSESTPGPIMVNISTYVGLSQAGILGALVATFAVVLPAFLLVITLTAFLTKVMKNKYVGAMLTGMNSCIIGIILVTGISMLFRNLYTESFQTIDEKAVLLSCLLSIIYFGQNHVPKLKLSPIGLIMISAILGSVVYAL